MAYSAIEIKGGYFGLIFQYDLLKNKQIKNLT